MINDTSTMMGNFLGIYSEREKANDLGTVYPMPSQVQIFFLEIALTHPFSNAALFSIMISYFKIAWQT